MAPAAHTPQGAVPTRPDIPGPIPPPVHPRTRACRIQDVVAISEEAGRAIMEVYRTPKEEWGLEHKSDESPVTLADLRAHDVIVAGLARIAPTIPVLSEEGGSPPAYGVRKDWESFFIVDPMDGTKDFIARTGEFTVNIGVVSRGPSGAYTPVAGVVHVPAQDTTWWAAKGQGAFMRDAEGGTQRIAVADRAPDAPGLTVVSSANHTSAEAGEFIGALFRDPKLEQVGSSLKLLLVACGRADCYPRLAGTCEGDRAAAGAIVREAGGRVVQAGGPSNWREEVRELRDVVYNKEDVLNPWFVVATPSLCRAIAETF